MDDIVCLCLFRNEVLLKLLWDRKVLSVLKHVVASLPWGAEDSVLALQAP